MKYSFNKNSKNVVFAGTSDINASYKDLGAVCDSIRYKDVDTAMQTLDSIIHDGMPIYYRRHCKHMGARHELQGKKGRYPKKCAKHVKSTLQNATSIAESKGYDSSSLFVVHVCANKTQTIARQPPRGILFHPSFGGYASARRSNIELAKIEVGVAEPDSVKLGDKAMQILKRNANALKRMAAQQKAQPKKGKPKADKGQVQAKQEKQPKPTPPKSDPKALETKVQA